MKSLFQTWGNGDYVYVEHFKSRKLWHFENAICLSIHVLYCLDSRFVSFMGLLPPYKVSSYKTLCVVGQYPTILEVCLETYIRKCISFL